MCSEYKTDQRVPVWQSILTSGMPDVSSSERRADSTGADAAPLPLLPLPACTG